MWDIFISKESKPFHELHPLFLPPSLPSSFILHIFPPYLHPKPSSSNIHLSNLHIPIPPSFWKRNTPSSSFPCPSFIKQPSYSSSSPLLCSSLPSSSSSSSYPFLFLLPFQSPSSFHSLSFLSSSSDQSIFIREIAKYGSGEIVTRERILCFIEA